MGKECSMVEISKLPQVEKDESELSLELSIGGNYQNSTKIDPFVEGNYYMISRSEFSCGKDDLGSGFVDLQKKKEIQAIRRQEARKKREEKLRKSRGLSLNSEAQKFQNRVPDQEKDGFFPAKKRVKNEFPKDLNLCLFSGNKILGTKSQMVQSIADGNGISSTDCDSGHSNGKNNECGGGLAVGSGSLERSSSAISDYQSTSHKGESSSDTGSHSSNSHSSIKSSSKTDTSQSDQTSLTNRSTASENNTTSRPPLSKEASVEKPPRPSNSRAVAHMPYVSTTGNGPNGKTVTGFLYKYSKSEVSIMCVCHGASFSPAEFVEHAGGVDVSHPLKHITILPSAFV